MEAAAPAWIPCVSGEAPVFTHLKFTTHDVLLTVVAHLGRLAECTLQLFAVPRCADTANQVEYSSQEVQLDHDRHHTKFSGKVDRPANTVATRNKLSEELRA